MFDVILIASHKQYKCPSDAAQLSNQHLTTFDVCCIFFVKFVQEGIDAELT